MSEKYYKPILKDGDHLVRSSKNPDRVRGQSRDADNKNPDIVEWEEVEIEDRYDYDYQPIPYEDRQVQLTPEEERIAREIGEALAAGTIWVLGNVVAPWWKRTAWPWVKGKFKEAVSFVKGKKKSKGEQVPERKEDYQVYAAPPQLANVTTQIDEAFEQFRIDMDEEEAKQHILNILFHMLEIANEIRIMSNAQIRRECESDEQYLERVKASENYLTERVAININRLLSDERLALDIATSRELFGLMGGGVRLNGAYVPVEIPKVYEAILAQDDN